MVALEEGIYKTKLKSQFFIHQLQQERFRRSPAAKRKLIQQSNYAQKIWNNMKCIPKPKAWVPHWIYLLHLLRVKGPYLLEMHLKGTLGISSEENVMVNQPCQLYLPECDAQALIFTSIPVLCLTLIATPLTAVNVHEISQD